MRDDCEGEVDGEGESESEGEVADAVAGAVVIAVAGAVVVAVAVAVVVEVAGAGAGAGADAGAGAGEEEGQEASLCRVTNLLLLRCLGEHSSKSVHPPQRSFSACAPVGNLTTVLCSSTLLSPNVQYPLHTIAILFIP